MAEEISVIGEIVKQLDRVPFQPFTIVMNSGERYEVTWNHQVAVGRDTLILLRLEATSVYMRSNQISSVEVLEPA